MSTILAACATTKPTIVAEPIPTVNLTKVYAAPTQIQWIPVGRAKFSKTKPMLLLAAADWCPACQELKKTLSDPKIVEIVNKYYYPIYLDVDQHRELFTSMVPARTIPIMLFFTMKDVYYIPGIIGFIDAIQIVGSRPVEELRPIFEKLALDLESHEFQPQFGKPPSLHLEPESNLAPSSHSSLPGTK